MPQLTPALDEVLLKRIAKAYVVQVLSIDPVQYHLSGEGAWVQIAIRLLTVQPQRAGRDASEK
jgi:hypothetical protein